MKQYPKLLLLLCSFLLAYLCFHFGALDFRDNALGGHGYISALLAGLLFSFGFTTAFGIGIFAQVSNEVNPLFGALIGAVGALISDYMIFHFLRVSFYDEIERLKSTFVLHHVIAMFHRPTFSERLRKYLLWSFAGIIIASPLPDEFGVSCISGSKISDRDFMIISYLCNTAGILFILLTASVVVA